MSSFIPQFPQYRQAILEYENDKGVIATRVTCSTNLNNTIITKHYRVSEDSDEALAVVDVEFNNHVKSLQDE